MYLAQSRGVPEIGLAFAGSMMLGVALTLSLVAMATAFARGWLLAFVQKHGTSVDRSLRFFDVATGVLLIASGVVRVFG